MVHSENVALFQLNYCGNRRLHNLDLIWANQSFVKTFATEGQFTENCFMTQFFQEASSSETSKNYCLYELMVMFRKKCEQNGIK